MGLSVGVLVLVSTANWQGTQPHSNLHAHTLALMLTVGVSPTQHPHAHCTQAHAVLTHMKHSHALTTAGKVGWHVTGSHTMVGWL